MDLVQVYPAHPLPRCSPYAAWPVAIYALSDPRGGGARYVGQTVNLYDRYWRHLHPGHDADCHRVRWLRKLLREGVQPDLQILAWVAQDEAAAAEKHFLTLLRALQCDLVNTDDAGRGGRQPGYTLTPAHRQAISAAHKRAGCMPGPRAAAALKEWRRTAAPDKLAAMQAQATAAKRTAQFRAKRSAISREIAQRPGMREKLVAAARKSQETPEQRQHNSERTRALWQDPEYRARQLASRRKRGETPQR